MFQEESIMNRGKVLPKKKKMLERKKEANQQRASPNFLSLGKGE